MFQPSLSPCMGRILLISWVFAVILTEPVAAEDYKLFDATVNTRTTGLMESFAQTEVWTGCQPGDIVNIYTPESEGGSVIVDNEIQVNGNNVCEYGDEANLTTNYIRWVEKYTCFNSVFTNRIGEPMEHSFRGIGIVELPLGPDGVIPFGLSRNRFQLWDWGGGSYGNTSLWLETTCLVKSELVADLGGNLTVRTSPAVAGLELTYEIRVQNYGPDPAPEVSLTSSFSSEIDYVIASPTKGSCEHAQNEVTCGLGDLAEGEQVIVAVTVAPTVPESLVITVETDSSEEDPEPANNKATSTVDVNPSEMLYFAQFGEGASQLRSEVILINGNRQVEENQASARLVLRDTDGNPLSTDLNGEIVAGALSTTIPPMGLRSFQTDGQGPITSGSVRAYSDLPLGGVIVFEGDIGVAGVGSSLPLESGFVAPIETNASEKVNTGIALANLLKTEISLDLSLCDQGNQVLASSRISLPAEGHLARFVDEFEWDQTVNFTDFRGLLKAEAPPQLAATVIQTRPGEFATMPVVERLPNVANGSSENTLHFAQFGDGEGLLFSQILLINQAEDAEASATISLRNDAGEPLEVDLDGDVVEGSLDVTIPAGGLRRLETDGEGDLAVGSVMVTSDQPLGGVVLFGGSAGVAGVGASEVLDAGFLAPIEKSFSPNINTGIAVMNLETEAITLELELLDPDGEQLATAEATLTGDGHQARFVNQFGWSESVDFSSFQGLLRVRSTGRCAATVIQTRANQFATMPVVPID